MTDGPPRPEFHRRTFPGGTSSIRDARIFIDDVSHHIVNDNPIKSDLALCVSELVTNAVEHGLDQPGEPGLTHPVTVTVTVAPDSIVLTVASMRSASAIAHPTTWTGPSPATRRGRGLAIVRALSDTVTVDVDDVTVTVCCIFRLT